MFGTLAATSADNLGNCALGGFKEGSTAYRGCRQCMATEDELKTKVCLFHFNMVCYVYMLHVYVVLRYRIRASVFALTFSTL